MTIAKQTKEQRKSVFWKEAKKELPFCLISLFLLLLLFQRSEIALQAMSAGLRLCAETLVPSLFPFMVASELLVASGLVFRIGKLLQRPFQRFFGMSGDAACAVLLGMVCGFPVGTRCAIALYRQHRLTEQEFTRLLAFSNHPSAAFLIHTVGASMLGSRRLGILLYATTLLSSLLIQVLWHALPSKEKESPGVFAQAPAPERAPSFPSALASAVSNSALALIPICAFVLFFSVFVECLTHLCDTLPLSHTLRALFFVCFELTGGVAHASTCATAIAPYLCAFAIGWAGLSVHFQLFHLCSDEKFSLRTYLLTKLAHGVLNALLLPPLLFFFAS